MSETEDIGIKLPKPYKHEPKIYNRLEELKKKGNKILNSIYGYKEVEGIFYLYLFKKYKSNCFLYNDHHDLRFFGLAINIMSNQSKAKMRPYNDHIDTLATVFIDCLFRNVKTVIIPIVIYDNKDVTHSNVLIYRKKFNQIEHFEPHGNYYMFDEKRSARIKQPILKFIEKVNNTLKEKGEREISYVSSDQVCPTEVGIQALEQESTLKTNEYDSAGYCAAWNMFFTELCLANPNVESKTLFEIIINYLKDKKNVEDYLRQVIRGYTFYIDEKLTKYLSIILGEKITVINIHKFYEDYDNKHEKVAKISKTILELIKLETYMITDKTFNLEKAVKSVKAELKKKGKKDDVDLLIKKMVIENYDKFNNFTPVTSNRTTDNKSSIKTPTSKQNSEKHCPQGKTLNPKTMRCNKNKSKSKTKKNKSTVTFETV